jgi:hypothetical protein
VKHTGYRGCDYSLIAMDDGTADFQQSVHKSDYVPKPIPNQTRITHRSQPSHLKLDSEQEHKFKASSFTHQVFSSPSEKMHLVPKQGAGMTLGGMVSRANDMFQVTVNNTVTRYCFFIQISIYGVIVRNYCE